MNMFSRAPGDNRTRLLHALAGRKGASAASWAAKDARYASLPALPAYREYSETDFADRLSGGRNDFGEFDNNAFNGSDYEVGI